MNCTKQISMTGYAVKFVDLREPRHLRTICEEVYPIDKAGLDSLNMMGVNVTDFIEARYGRSGYHVISVERISPKRSITIDLRELWTASELPTTAESPAAPEMEVANVEA